MQFCSIQLVNIQAIAMLFLACLENPHQSRVRIHQKRNELPLKCLLLKESNNNEHLKMIYI